MKLTFLLLCGLAALAAERTAMGDPAMPELTLAGHASPVLDVAFSPDGKLLASVADDGLLKLWNLPEKKEIASVNGARTNSNHLCFTPDGAQVLCLGSENNLIAVNIPGGQAAAGIKLSDAPGGASAFDLAPDGKQLAVSGRGGVRIFDRASGALTQSLAVHAGYDIPAVCFSPDGKLLATGSTDNTACIIDMATGRLLQTFKLDLNATAVAFSPDAHALFVATTSRLVQRFDLASGEAKTIVDRQVPIFTLRTSADKKQLILGGPGHGPWIVTLADGALQEPAFTGDAWVKAAAASPDGRHYAGGTQSGDIYLWKAAN